MSEYLNLEQETLNFVGKYLDRGAGSFSGRELELLVLDFILEIDPKLKENSIFEKSQILKVTETKLKNMIYEINLRKNDKQNFIKSLERNINSITFEQGKFVIEVDDLFTKKKLKHLIKLKGFITDSSFNSDLVKIPYEGLFAILEENLPKKKKELQKLRLKEQSKEIISSIKIPYTEINTKSVYEILSYTYDTIKNKKSK